MYGFSAAVNACLVAALLAASAGVALSNDLQEEITFPYLLKMAPGNVLVVHGHDFTGEVWLTYAPGDSLRVDGLPVYPPPRIPPKVLSEAGLAGTYGRVDYVRQLVDSGYTWRRATEDYKRRRRKATADAVTLYRSVMDSTGDTRQAAAAVADSFDCTLLEPGTVPRISESRMVVHWQGCLEEYIWLRPINDPGEEGPRLLLPVEKTEAEKARGRAQVLIHFLSGSRKCPLFFNQTPGGYGIWTGERYDQAVAQLEEAKRGNIIEGPMKERDLRRVIEAQGGDRR